MYGLHNIILADLMFNTLFSWSEEMWNGGDRNESGNKISEQGHQEMTSERSLLIHLNCWAVASS